MSLRVQNLSVLKDRHILEDVSFILEKGECLSIIGNNGSGKSTLLKCILGQEIDYTGHVFYNDEDLKKISAMNLAKIRSYVPQGLDSENSHSVEDFIYYARYRSFQNETSENLKAELNHLLSDFQLLEKKNQSLSSLSGGERRKVYICAALFQDADILLLDEIYSSLDFSSKDLISQILKNYIKDSNKILIQITHDLNIAFRSSDKILALKKGKIISYGSPTDTAINKNLNLIFDKNFQFIDDPDSSIGWIKC